MRRRDENRKYRLAEGVELETQVSVRSHYGYLRLATSWGEQDVVCVHVTPARLRLMAKRFEAMADFLERRWSWWRRRR